VSHLNLINPKQKRKQKITASREETAAKPQRMLLVLGPALVVPFSHEGAEFRLQFKWLPV